MVITGALDPGGQFVPVDSLWLVLSDNRSRAASILSGGSPQGDVTNWRASMLWSLHFASRKWRECRRFGVSQVPGSECPRFGVSQVRSVPVRIQEVSRVSQPLTPGVSRVPFSRCLAPQVPEPQCGGVHLASQLGSPGGCSESDSKKMVGLPVSIACTAVSMQVLVYIIS